MTTETFFANFGHLADAPNGVRKLRELILQLAVQGKLVPQDPEDEPASVLLEKIEAEKKKLAKEGKIKKIKPILEIKQEEQPYELPNGWSWSKLGNLAEVTGGFAFKSTNYSDDGMRVVRISDFDERGFKDEKVVRHQFSDELNNFRLDEGNILMAMTGGTVGKSLLVKLLPEPMVVNQRVATIKIITGILPEYVNGLIRTSLIQDVIKTAKNSTNDNISMGDILAFWVPLPPLAEQKRIVAKVDQLMTLCDELQARQKKQQQGRVRLNAAALDKLLTAREPAEFADHWQRISTNFDLLYDHPETIAKLRAAILQLAVQGKLVPQDPNDEPASVLLERIRVEKERLVKGGKIKKAKVLEPVSVNEVPFDLPDGWDVERFGDLTSTVGGVTKGRKLSGRKTATYPYLRVANVQRWFVDLDVVKEIEIPVEELDKYKLLHGDLLITEGGDWDKVGRTAVWEGQIENCLHQNHVFRSRLFVDDICRDWLVLTLNSPVGREYFAGSAKQTTNLASINMTQLKHFPMPVPPVEEQKRIVAKVDQLMTLCDELEVKLNQVQQHNDKLVEVTVLQLLVA